MDIQVQPAVISDGAQFGRMLKLVRISVGQSQEKLAESIGVSRMLISRRERHDVTLSIDSAIVHLAACGYVLAVAPATDALP